MKIDREDLPLLRHMHWSMDHRGYCIGTLCGRTVRLHRLIAGAGPGQVVDHINGDIKDNRRCNLRLTTQSTNMRNCKSRNGGYKGVEALPNGRFRARICVDRKLRPLGTYNTAERAARAYDEASRRLDPLSPVNFPQVGERCAVA